MTKWYNADSDMHVLVLCAAAGLTFAWPTMTLAEETAPRIITAVATGSSLAAPRKKPRFVKSLKSGLMVTTATGARTSNGDRLLRTSAERATTSERLPQEVEFQNDVIYGQAGGHDLKLDILRLKHRATASVPAIIYIHGGGWKGGSKEKILPLVVRLAEEGFVCFNVDYRLTGEAVFPAQIQDCRQAVQWVRTHGADLGIDPDRIGVCGGSAGGHLASLLGSAGEISEFDSPDHPPTTSSRVQAVVNISGPTDLMSALKPQFDRSNPAAAAAENKMMNRRKAAVTRLIGGEIETRAEVALAASPLHWVSKDDPPFLFICGDKDTLVPMNQCTGMHEALEKKGVESKVHVVKGGGHVFITPDGLNDAVSFFKKHLGTPDQEN